MKKILILVVGLLLLTACGSGKIVDTNYKSFQKMVSDKDTFVLEIVKDGCKYCEEFKPVFQKVIKSSKITAYRLSISDLSDSDLQKLLKEYEVQYTPTTMFFKKGEEVLSSRLEGSVPEARLTKVLKKLEYVK